METKTHTHGKRSGPINAGSAGWCVEIEAKLGVFLFGVHTYSTICSMFVMLFYVLRTRDTNQTLRIKPYPTHFA